MDGWMVGWMEWVVACKNDARGEKRRKRNRMTCWRRAQRRCWSSVSGLIGLCDERLVSPARVGVESFCYFFGVLLLFPANAIANGESLSFGAKFGGGLMAAVIPVTRRL